MALVGACSHPTNPAAPRQQKVLDVGVDPQGNGACLLVTDTLPPEVSKLPVVGCTAPHTHEIYAKIPYADPDPTKVVDVYPGQSALETFAEKACITAFEPYVGTSPFDSRLVPTWLLPTLKGWNDSKDHSVLCVLADPQKGNMTASMRDAKV